MTHDDCIVIEVFGEGRTDVGDSAYPEPPREGVLPILLHTLCGKPDKMYVKRYGRPFLGQKGTLKRKVCFARRQAFYNQSNGAVFVVDSDGDLRKKRKKLDSGRELGPSGLPMAIGVAHPCIESWLLSDADALCCGLNLTDASAVPEKPEELPAPCRDRRHNPKTVLAALGNARQKKISVEDKNNIAKALSDMSLLRNRCPQGFAPFADEVETHIRPLF